MYKDEWTQEEFLHNRNILEARGTKVLLIDTINRSIEGAETILYNPHILKNYPNGTVFVFYCDTGKTTKERLEEFRTRFPQMYCISLRGGRAYWRRTKH